MAGVELTVREVLTGGRAAAPGWRLAEGFAEAEPVWRAFETEALGSPFQRFDWCRAYGARVIAGRDSFLLAILTGSGGRPVLMLPLHLRRRAGLTVAGVLGDAHASFHLPLFRAEAPPLDAAQLRRLGAQAGIDLFRFTSQPAAWGGPANPLAPLFTARSAEDAFWLALEGDCSAVLRRRLSKDSLNKLRRKEKRLAETGQVLVREAQDEPAREAALAAFLTYRAARFAARGIADPFADPAIRAFLADAARTGALHLFTLTAGDRICAVYGAAIDGERFCGMFTAFDGDPEIARWSPGDQLLHGLVSLMCRRGLQAFDLGVGEARYKRVYCDRTEPLFDTLLPVSLPGRIAAEAFRAKALLKRSIKRSPRAMAAVDALRRLRARG